MIKFKSNKDMKIFKCLFSAPKCASLTTVLLNEGAIEVF